MTYSFIEDNRSMGFVFETTEKDGEQGVSVVMAALPRMLYHAPAKLALVAAVISTFLGAAHLGFVGVDWKAGKRVSPSPLVYQHDIVSNARAGPNLRLPPQHHVPAHHKQHPYPLRPRLHLRNAQVNLALPRRLRQLPRLAHERQFDGELLPLQHRHLRPRDVGVRTQRSPRRGHGQGRLRHAVRC